MYLNEVVIVILINGLKIWVWVGKWYYVLQKK